MTGVSRAACWLLDTLGGCCELTRLGVISRFRFGGPYWRWRKQTAWGDSPTPGGHLREILGYARWVWRIRHGQ